MGRAVSRASWVAWGFGLFLLLTASPVPLTGQAAADRLPLDPVVRQGRLANGFRYFVRRNVLPPGRILMRLIVNAGSIDEADDQRGIAHALEHMAFKGSTHYPSGELVRYFESLGARLGAHVNATTSYDQTVYLLDIPSDRDGALTHAVDAFADVANGLTLDKGELDRERAIITEEWRNRLGATSRVDTPRLAALFAGSRYADHRPIGTPESIQSFTIERLRDFYRDFYRADRMALIVVGDVDVRVEALIQTAFASLPVRDPQPRQLPEIPAHADTRFVVVADPEIQRTTVTVLHTLPRVMTATTAGFRQQLAERLVFVMLSQRFAEAARQPNAPFLGSSVGMSHLAGAADAVNTTLTVSAGGTSAALQAMSLELRRVRELGFGDQEIALAKRDLVSSYDFVRADSTSVADRIQGFVVFDQAALNPADEAVLVRGIVPVISAADLQARARALFADDSRVVMASMPTQSPQAPVTDASLRKAIEAGTAAPLMARGEVTVPMELMAKRPTAGTVRSRREIAELGVVVLTLSNGVDVWLKPNLALDARIEFGAYARGGALLSPPEQYFAASMAPLAVQVSGVGGLTPLDVNRVRGSRIATVTPYINSQTQGVTGTTSKRDLELALQLTYLYFTSPNVDRTSFERVKAALAPAVSAQAENPASVFNLRRQRLNASNHPRFKETTQADVAALDMDRLLQTYRERFANAANFTFVFAGPFTEADITPLLVQYVAALPSTGARDARVVEDHLEFPAAITREVFAKGHEPRAQTALSFFADTRLDEVESLRVRIAAIIVESQLRLALREQLGATYTVDVAYTDVSPTPGFGTVSVQYVSAPANSERLTASVLSEITRLVTAGPASDAFGSAKEAYKRQLTANEARSMYWAQSLLTLHMLGRDPRVMLERVSHVDALTAADVQAAIRKYFDVNRYTLLVMNPEP